MKYKKKIDEIYRDGLHNAGTPPPADSWEIISARLSEEKKERVLPLWIKWGGVAAVFALLLTVFNFTLLDNSLSEPVVNHEEKVVPTPSPASEITREAEQRFSNTKGQEENKFDDNFGNSPSEKTASEAPASEAVAVKNKIFQEGAPSSDVVAAKDEKSEDKSSLYKTRTAINAVAEQANKNVASENVIITETPEVSPQPEALAYAADATEKVLEAAPVKENSGKETLKEDIAFAEAEPEATASKNESFLKRFRISTTAGAVYMDIGNSNTIDDQLASNSGGSDLSMAYGVNIAYQVSEKVKIRSGVSKVNFNYSTPQIDYSAASNSSAVRTDPAGMGIMLAAQGDLNQEFGFIEVPMEVEFALIDKKIGLNLIGGASTLFLQENNLSMATPAFTTDFGEAQDLNDLSFSANMGIGVHYNFSSKIRLNLEPMFKYQLNTFDHGNSHYFAIYSGLSYQF